MKLHLGCGARRLDGFVNVDIAGDAADVRADLRDLPFGDASAEYIVSIHVIEHFHQWEVGPLLREWRRVLRPGGTLHLECPNILLAARNFVAGMESGDMEAALRLGFMAFYGEWEGANPYMTHRWGFWPESLAGALRDAGFEGMTLRPPQTHMREARDMAMTAIRPVGK